jgi:hypothetical protein
MNISTVTDSMLIATDSNGAETGRLSLSKMTTGNPWPVTGVALPQLVASSTTGLFAVLVGTGLALVDVGADGAPKVKAVKLLEIAAVSGSLAAGRCAQGGVDSFVVVEKVYNDRPRVVCFDAASGAQLEMSCTLLDSIARNPIPEGWITWNATHVGVSSTACRMGAAYLAPQGYTVTHVSADPEAAPGAAFVALLTPSAAGADSLVLLTVGADGAVREAASPVPCGGTVSPPLAVVGRYAVARVGTSFFAASVGGADGKAAAFSVAAPGLGRVAAFGALLADRAVVADKSGALATLDLAGRALVAAAPALGPHIPRGYLAVNASAALLLDAAVVNTPPHRNALVTSTAPAALGADGALGAVPGAGNTNLTSVSFCAPDADATASGPGDDPCPAFNGRNCSAMGTCEQLCTDVPNGITYSACRCNLDGLTNGTDCSYCTTRSATPFQRLGDKCLPIAPKVPKGWALYILFVAAGFIGLTTLYCIFICISTRLAHKKLEIIRRMRRENEDELERTATYVPPPKVEAPYVPPALLTTGSFSRGN